MPSPLVECVPNFSEGRDPAVIAALRAAVTGVSGVTLLDVQSDAAHHRSVFTFVAPPAAAVEAAFRAMRVAKDRIDLTTHAGEHPRMGATDVVPFVPVRDVTMDDCVMLAKQLAERAARELEIPIYLYARAAQRPERERLPDVRKGEFEGLRDRIGTDPAADPDAGPKRIHPTAGATAIGARPFLVAFNVYLDTGDVAVAKEIAKTIRTSSGGLPAVQASGFTVEGLAQVSMNLLDIDVTSPATAFAAIETAARARKVAIKKSELVGLVPERAILGAGAAALRLPDPTPHLLEAKIRAAQGPSLDGWIDELAGGAPVPGGGSASALAGTLAAALVTMVARLTVGRKTYAAVEARAQEILAAGERLRAELRRLVDDDA
ncbi:MAG TPA: glutamate formimidoyltransferase, partial [Gemmatimonadales bacterium]|nr:glutamate formimidoyltransferase [Gemmatimonadales bacterium]